jgi:uncharacterized protein YutE (UPF0331/DUF86 family)
MLKEVNRMYFVDRQKIEETLVYIEKLIELFSKEKEWSTQIQKAALERIVQMLLEAVIDVGNAMIDGFIMRDPGSYEDIVDILMDEKVVSEETGNTLKRLISYRKVLVQSYTQINHLELQTEFAANLQIFSLFASNVREYLINELGPVSAFRN